MGNVHPLVGRSVARPIASAIGALIPAVFKGWDIDLAIASDPFVPTVNDVTGIVIYLNIATVF